jgi:hypothetical protein
MRALVCVVLLSCTQAPSNADCNVSVPNAKRVTLWKVPEACERKGGSGTVTIKSEAELKAHFDCKSPSGIDWKTQSLVIMYRSMSPAYAGNDVLDDGKKVTVVEKFRNNCPKDPLPMPAPYTLTFLLPAGATRTFVNANCNVVRPCN